jgi:NADPH:quinone reductase-like Zn-dependent oxidoreductase
MKAVICTQYGNPEVLEIQEVKTPVPQKNQLLVRVIATAVNSGDVRVRGLVANGMMKLMMRFALGFSKPRKPILGTVFSGIVESVGTDVTLFKTGDQVFGMTGFKFGTHAEYLVINEQSHVMAMPQNAGFEEAVAIVFGGQTAIYFLEKVGLHQKPHANILIIGATGSVGVAAIQIAQFYKGKITAVCSSAGADLIESLGVSNIILYDQEDFTKTTQKFDFIFDAVGKYSKKQIKHLLQKKGIFKTVGGFEYAAESKKQLSLLKELYESGKLTPVIDKVYDMNDVVEAHRYVDTGRKKGNVILKMTSN